MTACMASLAGPLLLLATAWNAASPEGDFAHAVAADRPVVWWRFDAADPQQALQPLVGESNLQILGQVVGPVKFGQEGALPPTFPAFTDQNRAAAFDGKSTVLKFADPGDASPLDFTNGDAITLEAWVDVKKLGDGQQMYVVGKGRTKNPGYPAENQNYALRLAGQRGQACITFLFRGAENRPGKQEDYHRWTSTEGFGIDTGWHHIAVTYEFGRPDSLAGYIDGQPVKGVWDYGGKTDKPPVVDNDELWIGSSLGGNPSSTFHGLIDEVALYRRALSPERISVRFHKLQPKSYVTAEELIPQNAVLLEIFHGIPDKTTWDFPVPEPFERLTQQAFTLVEVPQLYTSHGVRGDRTNPCLLRMSGWVTWPAGDVQLALRSRGASRLWIDGELVLENQFPRNRGDGHNEMYDMPDNDPLIRRPVQPGDFEVSTTIKSQGQPHRVQMDVLVGGRKHRPELGELVLTAATANQPEHIVGYSDPVRFLTADWLQFVDRQRQELQALNQQRRIESSHEWAEYWKRRHEQARSVVQQFPPLMVPQSPDGYPANNDLDRFLNAKLAQEGVQPLPLTDDLAFLRRIYLDITGAVPTLDDIANYPAEARAGAILPEKRLALIDRLLEHHPGWADHWVGYWQDVLAENPNLVNPTLNNTGPFRWWLHESFLDNKPFDRFATELILMEGSTHFGGPAGFALATQNDAPMAAKAHILAQAFLGMEMKCARCHDAPYHQFAQKDLFSLASMLNREPVKVPKTSSIPGDPKALQSLLVKVSLKPGEPVPAEWPFAEELSGRIAADMLVNASDRREQLAALVTSPSNHRFAQVIVNRLWQRYFGRGLVEPVDDWEHAEPSHPELLDYLERELIQSGYNLKHVARLIFQSHAYQRQTDALASGNGPRAALFAGPSPRRLTAEQIVDSLVVISGKPLRVEEINIDTDSMRTYEQSLSLGVATKAWHFTSLSNERDRPALSLPAAQTVIDVLETFGWRGARPDPLTTRSQETTVLQPSILANGVFAKRSVQLSEDSRFTELALDEHRTVVQYIDSAYLAVLGRMPARDERQTFHELLQPGYDQRLTGEPAAPVRPLPNVGVAWSNHLKPEASDRKIALAHELQKGDPPTRRLTADWRERAEDFVWTLVNSPEFVFVP